MRLISLKTRTYSKKSLFRARAAPSVEDSTREVTLLLSENVDKEEVTHRIPAGAVAPKDFSERHSIGVGGFGSWLKSLKSRLTGSKSARSRWSSSRSQQRSSFYLTQKHLLEKLVDKAEATHGTRSLKHASALENLADFLREHESFREASRYYPRVVRIREQLLGEVDPTLGRALHFLAATYHAQALYDDAEPLYERAILVRQLALGKYHPDVAESLNAQSGVYLALQRGREGLRACKQALAIRERVFKHDDRHPLIRQSLMNTARLLKAMHKYKQATPYLDRLAASGGVPVDSRSS
ncbi:hypothetical protein CTAYLR_000841 [Chrysophaeum taylorii]|uniref:Kinesin light chain n=1 Tax=Chrysophaeum taylorii TaxID=2483200 RepID=A0AAD7UQZ5_9STRA|nr:hypothetical protein CTAYLR_000841 [Chrysophaeum taylorii]